MLERDYRYTTLIRQVTASPSTALCVYLHLLHGTGCFDCDTCRHKYGFHAYRCCATLGLDFSMVLK